nr:CRISPR-associated endonuclease Cas3'' [Micromonospora sp. DSM 115978]
MLTGVVGWSQLAVLWAKTGGSGGWHPLWAHALDAAAAADWLWCHGLAPSARRLVSDRLPGGEEDGRLLLCWLAALHDLGKASPAFQVQQELRAGFTRESFASLPSRLAGRERAPHQRVSAA